MQDRETENKKNPCRGDKRWKQISDLPILDVLSELGDMKTTVAHDRFVFLCSGLSCEKITKNGLPNRIQRAQRESNT